MVTIEQAVNRACDMGVTVIDGKDAFKVGNINVRKTADGQWAVRGKVIGRMGDAIMHALNIVEAARNFPSSK